MIPPFYAKFDDMHKRTRDLIASDYQTNRVKVRLGILINKLVGDHTGSSENGISSS